MKKFNSWNPFTFLVFTTESIVSGTNTYVGKYKMTGFPFEYLEITTWGISWISMQEAMEGREYPL